MGTLRLETDEGRLVRANLIAECRVEKIVKAESRLPDEFTIKAQMIYLAGNRYGDVDLSPASHQFGRYRSETLAARRMRDLVERIADPPTEQAAVIRLPADSELVIESVGSRTPAS
ncbi:hypothetical protein [Nocardia cerradoensis]|uniref:hypothetical protein n=1 Tax=Nocardia cerradoensis TaxID=85688 RepID=UPI00031C0439|nr:hypothetical protein [Nocardia cerradoensis]NKY45794.1 hypothetical protein [Nocardia cerradoensis]